MSRWEAVLRRRGYFLLALAVLLADQASKVAAHAALRGRSPLVVVPGAVNLWYSRNPGGLFGYFRDWDDPWRTLLLTLLPLGAIALIFGFIVRGEVHDRVTLAGLALILGGAVGNLIDRILRGEVVDFIDVYAAHPRLAEPLVRWFDTAHWPTFNVADSAIVVGAGLLLLDLVRPRRAAGERQPGGVDSTAPRCSRS
jgi:signal peptidase II